MKPGAHGEDVTRPGGQSFKPGLVLFIMMAGFSLIRTGRDAMFFQESGIYDLPVAYLVIAALSVPQSILVLWMLQRFGPRTTRILVPTIVSLVVVGVALIAEPGRGAVMTSFFVFVPLAFAVLFSLSWLITGELNEEASTEEKVKSYARVGAASIGGGIVGAGTAALLPEFGLGPQALLISGAAVIMLGAGCILWTHATTKAHPRVGGHSRSDGFGAVFKAPNAYLVLGVSMAAALSAVLIDFQFYLAAAKSQGSGSELASFFARIYLLLNVGSMFLQLLIAPRIQKRLGLAGALLVLPVVLLGGAAYGVLSSALAVRAGLRVAEGGLKSGLHRTLWEQTFLQFPRAVRSSAKVMIDGLGARLAEGIAGLSLYIWLLVVVKSDPIADHSTLWVTVFLGVSTLVWLSITVSLRRRVRQVEFHSSALVSAAPPPDF
jgi:hypothetical protein